VRWIVGIPLALVASLLALAFLGPQLVDWNSYKAALEREITQATGYAATVDGNIGASLLPTPRVTVAAVSLRHKERPLVAVRWLEAKLRLSDILRGEPQVVELLLVEPRLTLGPEGLFGMLPTRRAETEAAEETDGLAVVSRPGHGAAGVSVAVRDATLVMETAQGPLEIAGIDGSLQTPTVGQRLTITGTLPLAGETIEVEARLAPPQKEADAPVSVRLRSPTDTLRARFNGTWTLAETGLGLRGEASVDLADVRRAKNFFGPGLQDIPVIDGPLRLETQVAYQGAAKQLNLAELTVNADQFSALGEAAVDLGGRLGIDLSLRFTRLDLDAALEAALSAALPQLTDTKSGAEEATEGGSEEARLPNLLARAKTFPVDLSVELTAAGTRFRGKLVQRLAVRGSLENGAVTLEEFSARLPGGADLSVAGFGDLTVSPPSLEGNASLRADDLRRFLEWTGFPVPEAAADRLRRFSLVSGVSLRPGRLDIVDASIELDDVTARGAAAVALRERLGIGLRLDVDQFNFDAFRSTSRDAVETDGAKRREIASPTTEPASKETAKGPDWHDFDASLDLQVGRVIAAGVPLNGLAANLVIRDGALTFNRVSVSDAAGISGEAGGRLNLQAEGEGDTLSFRGETDDLGRLAAVLGGPDLVTGVLRSIGPGSVDVSYDPLRGEGPVRVGVQGKEGTLTLALRASSGSGPGSVLVDLQSGALETPAWRVESASGEFEFGPGGTILRGGRGRVNGGVLTLDLSFLRRPDGIRDLSMTGRVEGLSVERGLGDLDGALGISGTVTLGGKVRASGSDWYALESANSGIIDLTGSLAVSVGPPRATIVNVRRVTDVRTALRTHFSKPGALTGRVTIENGNLLLDGVRLNGIEGSTIEASGSVDLKRRSISAQATLQSTGENAVRARLSATGNSSAPNLRLSN